MATKAKRLSAGIYEAKVGQHTFEIEAFNKADWLLFYMAPKSGDTHEREYIKDFWRKADALEWLDQNGARYATSPA